MDYLSRYLARVKENCVLALCACVLLMTFGIDSVAQSKLIPRKYLKIVPGVSTRENVKKVFPLIKDNGQFARFEGRDLVVSVEYSSGVCSLPLGWGKLPIWTVETISYEWPEGKPVRLNEIMLDPTQFQKQERGDVSVHDYYVNEELGIKIVHDRKWKEVLGIHIEPSRKLRDQYACRPEN